jgi:hypothetical protein
MVQAPDAVRVSLIAGSLAAPRIFRKETLCLPWWLKRRAP